MTWGDAPEVVATIRSIMLDSRETFVHYTMPLGLHHLIGGDHYAPMPENADARRADWSAIYYHRADATGIGYDRSRRGSGAVDQYRAPLRDWWGDPASTPDELLLWFHRLPWDYRMTSGRTLWDELVFTYGRGAEEAKGLETRWTTLAGKVDDGTVPGRARQAAPAIGRGRGVARQMPRLLSGGPRAAAVGLPVTHLTKHRTARGARWAVDGRLLAEDFQLRRLLELTLAEMPGFLRASATAEPADGTPLAPVEDASEVWAAGVTYLRSRERARGGIDRQGRVCEGLRRRAARVVLQGAGMARGGTRRADSHPPRQPLERAEPELTLVVNSHGEIAGFCAGNDVSSRDIEGENPLYLPQAKVYNGSCALGPGIALCGAEALRDLAIDLVVQRHGREPFHRRDPHVADQAPAAGTGRLPAARAGLPAWRLPHDRHGHRAAGRLLAAARRRGPHHDRRADARERSRPLDT